MALIESAKKFKSKPNIVYKHGDATEDFESIFGETLPQFTKFLINDATAYFTPGQLDGIIKNISKNSNLFSLYLTNIPNDDKKWNFYNTPERKKNFEDAVLNGDKFLGGIGRWWKKTEFEELAQKHQLKITFIDSNDELNYRLNVLIDNY